MSGDIITFKPNTSTNPTFVGKGSKIEHPDILPIFRGSYWPGTGDFTVQAIMKAFYALASGPYLSGLTQYGYVGPAQVRIAMIDTAPISIALPAPAPGVSQSAAIGSSIHDYIEGLLNSDGIDNVDDNHDLIVVVFLDPSILVPLDTDNAGIQTTIGGANTSIEEFEFLDDNTRFEWAWINTSSRDLSSVTGILSHELVESITDPFGTGWERTSPPYAQGQGQIADVCNQPAIVDGVGVLAYWSAAANACIVPTSGTRRVSLSQTLATPEPHDELPRQGYVDLPAICGGAQYFSYFERTYLNSVKVTANLQGYESPLIAFTINGKPVPILQGKIDVPAVWDPEPRSNPLFPDFDVKPSTATLQTYWAGSPNPELDINVGPNAGNTDLNIMVTVTETFDTPALGGGSTKRTAFLDLPLRNQEIIWDQAHNTAVGNCNARMNMSNHLGVVVGGAHPGDPPDLLGIISRALHDESSSRAESLRKAAQLVKSSHPEVAKALNSLAQRAS